MASNSFSLDLRAYVAKAKDNMNAVARESIIDIAKRLVEASPVGDPVTWQHPPPKSYTGGRFRGSWSAAVDAPPTEVYRTIDAEGTLSVDRITAAIPTVAGGNIFYIANNSPYAVRLEEGWSYMQAPLGIVGLTVFDWEQIVTGAVSKVNGGAS